MELELIGSDLLEDISNSKTIGGKLLIVVTRDTTICVMKFATFKENNCCLIYTANSV